MNTKFAEQNYEYKLFNEFLEKDNSPKAKQLLEKLNSFKTNEEYLDLVYELRFKSRLQNF